jgi:crotonyl-CoA reductase
VVGSTDSFEPLPESCLPGANDQRARGQTRARSLDGTLGPVGLDAARRAAPATNLAQMSEILDAVRSGASPETLASTPMPTTTRAVFVRRDEQDMFAGMASKDKDPRRSLHVDEVALPELAPDEVYLAVMASSINFNSVWTSIFEPLATFGFLDRLAKESYWGRRHALDYHVIGSDASGVVLRAGSEVRNWKVGDEVTVHCNYVDDQDPSGHDDSMMAGNQRIWGFETNFGGLADICVVKANQLMPKPTHLTWEESAVNALCNSTAYRMLVSRNGAPVTQGDKVLIWGASGGIGSFAVQHVLNSGGTPIGVVSSEDKVDTLHELGCRHVINRREKDYRFWQDEHTQDESEWRRLGKDIRALVGDDPDIVFEHPGRSTMGASVFVAKRGGTIVTCAATSGYMIEYDNRHLWMKLKTIKGSHFSNYREAWAANQTIIDAKVVPPLSAVFTLDETGEAAYEVHHNRHEGKIGILCASPKEGLGVTDPELRASVGAARLSIFRRHDKG